MRPGLHLVHKPVGVTSFSIVRELMEGIAARGAKLPICHGGTLDPFAEGLMLILAGQTTRLMDLFHVVPKVYAARIAWGRETDNGDLHGTTVFQGDSATLTPAALDAALGPMLGWQDQVPPATSAKKIGGEPAYRKAHRGEAVVLPPSRVFLHEARWLSHDLPRTSELWIRCKGGYYVRSLARDLGRALGCGAHVQSLRRLEIGPWRDPAPGVTQHVAGESLLSWLPRRVLSSVDFDALRMGQAIDRGEVIDGTWHVPEGYPKPPGPIRALFEGRLVATLRDDGTTLHPLANLRGGL